MKSQTIPGKNAKKIIKNFEIKEISDFLKLRKKLYSHLKFIKLVNEKLKKEEIEIRWKRTGEEILEQKKVYSGKSCTDIIIAFMTLLNAFSIPNKFIKVKKQNAIHSIVQFDFDKKTYLFDVSGKNYILEEGFFEVGKKWYDWEFWKIGKDSWDIGMTKYENIKKY